MFYILGGSFSLNLKTAEQWQKAVFSLVKLIFKQI